MRLQSTLSIALIATGLFSGARTLTAQPVFGLPTANTALFEPGGEEKYFAATPGRTWQSGSFGCVRSEGFQFHEGLDIRSVERDQAGEPIDPVLATAAGTVAYLNQKPGLSNYGKYIILRHYVEGIEIFSLYAHLSEIGENIQVGGSVMAGEQIGIMGRTANTRQAISKDRAHVHFELGLLINDRFADWFKKRFPGQRNDHGRWNGRNLAGIDPRAVLTRSHEEGRRFSILQYIRNEPELCRVFVRDTEFPWLLRYRPLIRRNSVAEKEGIVGYEVSLSFNGVPVRMIPRADSEIDTRSRYELLSVNEDQVEQFPCGKLVARKAGGWHLTNRARDLLDQLTH